MKNDTLLTITSLLAVVLFSFHLVDEVARGMEPGGLNNVTGMLILLVWTVGALLLNGRLAGYILLFLGSLLAVAVPVLHMSGKGVSAIGASPGGFFFVWVLYALGVTGAIALILTVRGLWGLRRRQPG